MRKAALEASPWSAGWRIVASHAAGGGMPSTWDSGVRAARWRRSVALMAHRSRPHAAAVVAKLDDSDSDAQGQRWRRPAGWMAHRSRRRGGGGGKLEDWTGRACGSGGALGRLMAHRCVARGGGGGEAGGLGLVVRKAALGTLGRLDGASLASHAAGVVAMLEHSDWGVRKAASETLGQLDGASLASHAAAVVAMLEHSHSGVRAAALETLRKLDGASLASHAAAVVAKLEDSDWAVRAAALVSLSWMAHRSRRTGGGGGEAGALDWRACGSGGDARSAGWRIAASHAAAVVAKLEHSDRACVRQRWDAR